MSVAVGTGERGEADERRVVVVGGGLAGITAALDCARGGVKVTLLESRPRLGGAVYSVRRNGLDVDNGQHVFLRCCTAYRELLAGLGAADAVTLQPRLAIPVLAPGRPPVWLRRSNLPAPLPCGRWPPCAASIPTTRRPTPADSATGCATMVRARRRSTGCGD